MGYRLIAIPLMVMVLLLSVSLSKEVSAMAAIQITSPAFQNNAPLSP